MRKRMSDEEFRLKDIINRFSRAVRVGQKNELLIKDEIKHAKAVLKNAREALAKLQKPKRKRKISKVKVDAETMTATEDSKPEAPEEPTADKPSTAKLEEKKSAADEA